MDNKEAKLIKVFQAVFPDMDPQKVPAASQASVAGWDSVAALTLMNVIEEEFEIQLDFDKAADLTSFQEILDYLQEVQPNATRI
jgi:acyl carrier protein